MYVLIATLPNGDRHVLGPYVSDPILMMWTDVDPSGIASAPDGLPFEDGQYEPVELVMPKQDGPVVELPGRHGAGQVDAMLSKSGLVEQPILKHQPIIAVIRQAEANAVRLVLFSNAHRAAELPRETALLWQWPGAHRSDFFHMTAGDIADHLRRERERREGI